MANKLRNLRLISSELEEQTGQESPQERFALVSLSELTAAEQRLLEHLVAHAVPGAGIIAVARTVLPWDLRPVVMKVGESQPSVVRLAGPLATSQHTEQIRLQSVFERVTLAFDASESFLDWGLYEGQLWFRRALFHATLAQEMQNKRFSAEELLRFAHNLIEQTISLHAYGVVHGHISTSNISVSADGAVSLFDVGIALSQLGAGFERQLSLAPELRHSREQPLPTADVYAVAQVCKRLILKSQREAVSAHEQEQLLLDALSERIEPMLSSSPMQRPALHEVLRGIRELQQSLRAQFRDQAVAHFATTAANEASIEERLPTPAKTQQIVQEPRKSMWWVYCVAFASVLFCAWTLYQRQAFEEPLEIDAHSLRTAWSSGMPSQMLPVVKLAREHPGSFAEQLLIRSVLKGESLPRGINTNLLRIAFDTRWEAGLSDADRLAATTLGTAGFLRPRDTSALEDLEERHPGLLYAITASAPKGAESSLSKLPAERLVQLPAPLGEAFRVLVETDAQLRCSDDGVRGLARFAAFGVERLADVSMFLQTDFSKRLRALSLLFAADDRASAETLKALLEHPNTEFTTPEVIWAKKWALEHWKIPNTAKLEVISGLAPQQRLDASYIAALFAHPSAVIRQYAVSEARDRIAFSHPASLQVLSMLVEEPNLLGPDQLLFLAKLLENPTKVDTKELTQWIQSKPPQKLLAALLLGTAQEPQASLLDTFAAMELNAHKWIPVDEQLALLIRHPDEYTRMMSYKILFAQGTVKSFELLQHAAKDERNPASRALLGSMLEQLHAQLNPQ